MVYNVARGPYIVPQEKYIAPLVVQMLQMMTDLEDEENWALEDEVEDVDSDVSFTKLPRYGRCSLKCFDHLQL